MMTIIKSRIFHNAAYLYLAQGTQYIIALISVPLLVQNLGAEGFGWISITGAFGGYLQLICEYGFQLNASRNIAINKCESSAISREVSLTLFAKLYISVPALLIAYSAIQAIPAYREHSELFAISALGALAAAFHPIWLYQGMEKMKPVAIISLSIKILQFALIVAFVKMKSDLKLAIELICVSSVVNTTIAWLLSIKLFNYKFILPKNTEIFKSLRFGFEIFISQASVLLFNNTNTLILGIYASPQAVGYYSIAEKSVRVIIQISAPIGTVLFPRTAILLNSSPEEAFRLLRHALLIGIAVFIPLCLALAIGSDSIILFACNEHVPEIRPLIWILSPLPLTIFINSIFGIQVLLNLGYKMTFMSIPLGAGVFSVILQTLIIPHYGATGAAISLASTELIIFFLYIFTTWKLTNFPFAYLSNVQAKRNTFNSI